MVHRDSLPRMTTKAAVILAAGVGSRLRPLTDDRPKALVSIGAETILGRAVRLLAAHGVERLVIASGYREDAIVGALGNCPLEVTYCHNPKFDRTQNSVSLALCRRALDGASFFKLDGDVVFLPEVLSRLDASRAPLAVAVDAGRKLDAEAMKVAVHLGTIRAFGKGLSLSESAGETIGIERIDESASKTLFDALDRARADGRTHLYYEDVYSELIAADALAAEVVDVADLPWTEVDDYSDLERARSLIATGA